MKLKAMFCSSLAKIMPSADPAVEIRQGCALRGERFSFQLAYKSLDPDRQMLKVKTESPFGKALRVRKVGLVPVEYTGVAFDDDIISKDPGMYPDLLTDADPGDIPALPTWRALWFTVDVPKNCKPGIYEIKVSLQIGWPRLPDPVYADCCSKTFKLEVLDAVIPEQKLKHTNWFHCDCLATYYNVPVFSEEHWKIIGNFMKSAAAHGINMILTPVFTPPLDTNIGCERPTVQLVGVTRSKGKYSFDPALTSQPKIRFSLPSTFATIFGVQTAPHWVKRWEISKYLMPDFSASLIQRSRLPKSKEYLPFVLVTPTS